ncbi:1-deoxy-D-xylulose-5-phosphate reductoisomerase [bacterium]|nr:1-deoxy-D-xylulose-5-phosphate reductoisomerase [bacterium]MBU1065350.1 1-deoxy-D-xylulose-5-phosphate reductoisomerase [bacterium]MBU1634747.1 1-deoxy-D-xylulose-5-phosphate reductoisomerase [bacterium]MBU1872182.1 1-deoxy-D-xylulose-5-phosphate reductoisomerase [bacterium]
MKQITILGSTGSIGANAIKVVTANPELFRIKYLSAGQNAVKLIEQAITLKPKAVAIADSSKALQIENALKPYSIEVLSGKDGILEIASRSDVNLVVNAIVGSAGLEPSIGVLNAGIDLALSNKESLVMAGEIINKLLKKNKLNLFPIDSEHSAIRQCLVGENPTDIRKLILTGSGGPFRLLPINQFGDITPEQALKHPTWNMGKKISIDSATMMNKGLEIIEAYWLFNVPPEKIEVLIHPQSIIHSMVEFVDGSIKAQLGLPDMKLPIQYALSYPGRFPVSWEATNFTEIGQLTFESPDFNKFPALQLAFDALHRGGTAPAILNVVNEFAVYAFLENKLSFMEIPGLVDRALTKLTIVDHPTLQDILEAEQSGREFVEQHVQRHN